MPSCVDPKGQKTTIYNEFTDPPKNDKHCGSDEEKDGLWDECKPCDKIKMCGKCQPFNLILWREQKFWNGNHMKNLDPEKEKQCLEDKARLNGK